MKQTSHDWNPKLTGPLTPMLGLLNIFYDHLKILLTCVDDIVLISDDINLTMLNPCYIPNFKLKALVFNNRVKQWCILAVRFESTGMLSYGVFRHISVISNIG